MALFTPLNVLQTHLHAEIAYGKIYIIALCLDNTKTIVKKDRTFCI